MKQDQLLQINSAFFNQGKGKYVQYGIFAKTMQDADYICVIMQFVNQTEFAYYDDAIKN